MGSVDTKMIWHIIVLFVRNFWENFDANIIASYVCSSCMVQQNMSAHFITNLNPCMSADCLLLLY